MICCNCLTFSYPYTLPEMWCTYKPRASRELTTKQSISGIEEQMQVPVSCPFTKNASVNSLCNELLAITVLSDQSVTYKPSKLTVCVLFFLSVKQILIFDVSCLVKSKNITSFPCISNLIVVLHFSGLNPGQFSQFFCIQDICKGEVYIFYLLKL